MQNTCDPGIQPRRVRKWPCRRRCCSYCLRSRRREIGERGQFNCERALDLTRFVMDKNQPELFARRGKTEPQCPGPKRDTEPRNLLSEVRITPLDQAANWDKVSHGVTFLERTCVCDNRCLNPLRRRRNREFISLPDLRAPWNPRTLCRHMTRCVSRRHARRCTSHRCMSGLVWSGLVYSGPVRSGPVRSGLVWSGLVWSGLVWSCVCLSV